MRDPIRILVKKDELTLEGIKHQFYIAIDREEWKFEVVLHSHHHPGHHLLQHQKVYSNTIFFRTVRFPSLSLTSTSLWFSSFALLFLSSFILFHLFSCFSPSFLNFFVSAFLLYYSFSFHSHLLPYSSIRFYNHSFCPFTPFPFIYPLIINPFPLLFLSLLLHSFPYFLLPLLPSLFLSSQFVIFLSFPLLIRLFFPLPCLLLSYVMFLNFPYLLFSFLLYFSYFSSLLIKSVLFLSILVASFYFPSSFPSLPLLSVLPSLSFDVRSISLSFLTARLSPVLFQHVSLTVSKQVLIVFALYSWTRNHNNLYQFIVETIVRLTIVRIIIATQIKINLLSVSWTSLHSVCYAKTSRRPQCTRPWDRRSATLP